MSRETKEERLVRTIYDQVAEHLFELKALEKNPSIKELDIERWCHSFLRSCLGYSAIDGYSILAQESRGRMRPDLIVSKNENPVFVVEIKKLGYDLNKSNFRSGKTQLMEYLRTIGGIKYGVLSNGYEWRLFDFSDPDHCGVEIVSFDVRNENDEIDISKRNIEDLCWNFIDLHEMNYNSGAWAGYLKEATAFSPESLAKAILSSDSIRYIARVIKGEFDYKANTEVLIDKICHLLENGLDDSIGIWNDEKSAELQKFIKLQKKSCRKKRKPSKKSLKDPVQAHDSEVTSKNEENPKQEEAS